MLDFSKLRRSHEDWYGILKSLQRTQCRAWALGGRWKVFVKQDFSQFSIDKLVLGRSGWTYSK